MTAMRTIIKVVSTAHTASSSSAARYISERELDRQREASGAREIFTPEREGLKAKATNRYLSADGREKPNKRELLHVVIAFRREDATALEKLSRQLAAISSTDKDKDEVAPKGDKKGSGKEQTVTETRHSAGRDTPYIQVVRETLAQLAKELKAEELHWAATVHRHTANAHVHLLMQKSYRTTDGEMATLNRLPKDWLNHRDDRGKAAGGLFDQKLSAALDELLPKRNRADAAPARTNALDEPRTPTQRPQSRPYNQSAPSAPAEPRRPVELPPRYTLTLPPGIARQPLQTTGQPGLTTDTTERGAQIDMAHGRHQNAPPEKSVTETRHSPSPIGAFRLHPLPAAATRQGQNELAAQQQQTQTYTTGLLPAAAIKHGPGSAARTQSVNEPRARASQQRTGNKGHSRGR
jgi:hypothetical protein